MLIDEMWRVMEACGFPAGTPLLVGVSGGPDSLTLLDGLHQLGYAVTTAHYDHRLRPESGADARQVELVAQKMGVPFVSGAGDVAAYARAEGLSVEEAARTLRYRFLFGEAQRLGCAAVAVGHTADDQVETVLMHFLRGAGLAGLRGMPACALQPAWDAHIPLVRPLLNVWREDVTAYCEARGLEPVIDASNQDTTFFRNRLRHELIPYLESYNPQIKAVLARTARTAEGDYAVLSALTQSAWEGVRLEEQPDFVLLSLPALRELEPGLRRGLLRLAVSKLRPGLRDIDFAAVERADRFAQQPTVTRFADLSAGLVLYASGERLFLGDRASRLLLPEWPQIAPGERYELPVPGSLDLPGGWRLESRWVENPKPEDAQVEDSFHAWLDAGCVELPLTVRARRPGDRFRPLGMEGHSLKLSDFWINERLPRPAREGWPLVCSGDEIAWVPGFRPAEGCRVGQASRRAVELSLIRVEKG